MAKIYNVVHVKYPLFVSDFNESWMFLTDFLICGLWFCVSSNIQIKTPNQMQQSIVKFIA
jgi:hypothetical protein